MDLGIRGENKVPKRAESAYRENPKIKQILYYLRLVSGHGQSSSTFCRNAFVPCERSIFRSSTMHRMNQRPQSFRWARNPGRARPGPTGDRQEGQQQHHPYISRLDPQCYEENMLSFRLSPGLPERIQPFKVILVLQIHFDIVLMQYVHHLRDGDSSNSSSSFDGGF